MIEIPVGSTSLPQHSEKKMKNTNISTDNSIPIPVPNKRPKNATMGEKNGQQWNIISINESVS